MTSTALQTRIECSSDPTFGDPQFEVAGVRIFARRDGKHVTGRVFFPYKVYGRYHIPIDYRSARPGDPLKSQISNRPLDSKARARLDLVNRWNELCKNHPTQTRAKIAAIVADSTKLKCSLRSLESWAKTFRLEGAAGLSDNYTPRPRKTLTLNGELAAQAVKVCAWWAFRIGNADSIDSKMMHSAAALCGRSLIGTILSTIDRYYSWPCDRRKMPFIPFARWSNLKYEHFEKWLLRAADISDGATVPTIDPAYRDGNFQHPHEAFTDRPVPLREPASDRSVPPCLRASVPSSTKTRIRDARDRGTVQAISALSEPRTSVRADPIQAILAPLDDAYRVMLIRASFKDRDAFDEAVATLPIWWDAVALPAETRERIDRVTFIKPSDRRPGDEPKIARAKVQMFLSELKQLRKGKA